MRLAEQQKPSGDYPVQTKAPIKEDAGMSNAYFDKVKEHVETLELEVSSEDASQQLLIVNDESRGIHELIIDCEEELLVIEQVIFSVNSDNAGMYKRLLQMNRELVHGAFVLSEGGDMVLFRDTLQLANLDLNELEASINALGLGLAAHAEELIGFAHAN